MWLVDVNGDGKQDIVALNGTKKLLTYLYTGKKFITSQVDGNGFASEFSSTFYPTNNKKDAPIEEKIWNSSRLEHVCRREQRRENGLCLVQQWERRQG
ncbi:MAG: hypothetical protein H7A23_04365 [Leptospiraceae bacterium]|nr:hypothetical protein [Leptospiraceae bacterium]MCP5493767.1 hypothetical protein [Leptospiraceae bacterium]